MFRMTMRPYLLLAALLAACILLGSCRAGRRSASEAAPTSLVTKKHEWGPGEKPWFCHNYQCPYYEVLETAGDVQLRRYPGFKWVAVNVTGKGVEDAQKKGMSYLEEYINGHNKDKSTLARTVPTITLLYPTKGKGKTVGNEFTVSLWLPSEEQDSPPKPTSSELDIVEDDEDYLDIWVYSFGGVATEREIVRRGFRFMDTLESEYKADIDDTTFGIAKYDEPWRLVGRHNEIHVRKAGKKNKNTK